MFESFTAGAERALGRADALAQRRGATLVEPVDLLAALSLEAESRAAELLAEFGVSAGWLRDALGPGIWDERARGTARTRKPAPDRPTRCPDRRTCGSSWARR